MLQYAAVTPVRDEEDNLRRLAESMLDQTYKPVAWIVVDNGSTDGTVHSRRGVGARARLDRLRRVRSRRLGPSPASRSCERSSMGSSGSVLRST